MTYTFLQLFPFLRILPPRELLGWLGWLVLLAASVGMALRLGGHGVLWTRKQQLRLLALLLAIPLAFILFTLRMPAGGALPIPDLGAVARGALLVPLLALPWMLALLWFGAPLAVLLAGLSGLLLAAWDTRSPFTPLEFALLAATFAFLRSQSYRTQLFTWLRKPLVAALALSLLYPLLYVAVAPLWVSPSWLVSFDFALSRLVGAGLAAALPLLLGAALLQLALARWPRLDRAAQAAEPAPNERSLEARFLFALVPLALVAFIALGALTWWGAGRTAQQLFADRVNNNLQIAADSLPFVLETGQNLVLQLAADTRLADAAPEQAQAILQNHLSGVPFFEQMNLLDTGGNSVTGIPLTQYTSLQPAQPELSAVALALQGVSLQIASAPPLSGQNSAQLVFIAPVRNSNGQVRNVLVGRTVLETNPFARPVAQSLESINALGAQAFLIDGQGQIVMAPFTAALLQPYSGQAAASVLSYEEVSADGVRQMVRYQPATGSNWAVVARWPLRLSQQLALSVALPILGVLAVMGLLAYLLLRNRLHGVSASLQTLAAETQRIAAGDLRAPLSITGTDEIGRLGSAFEVMRQAVLTRSEDTQRLLTLSHGLSSSLEVRGHIEPLLEAALASGAALARLVLLNENGLTGVSVGRGEGHERYEALDAQLVELTRKRDQVLLQNPARAGLKVERGTPHPGSVAAFALKDGTRQLGTLWLAYDQPQRFEERSRRYLETLAAQASSAATNAGEYFKARVGQQRLEAVLAADPQALLVLDPAQNLVFANAAAAHILRLRPADLAPSTPVARALHAPELLKFLRTAGPKPHAAELQIGQAAYHATLNPLWAGAELLGFMCTLEDVTQSKQRESARLDTLNAVGRDLQELLEKLAGLLIMVRSNGVFNEHQEEYAQKSEELMAYILGLVSNLLADERSQEAEELKLESFSLGEVLSAVQTEVEGQARQKQIELVIDPSEGKETLVRADRAWLQRILVNLVENAIKFSPRGRKVTLSVIYQPHNVHLTLRDHGVGIAPVDLPSLLERQPGKSVTSLQIARSILERHQGRLWVESELGLGSTFHLELPSG